MKNLSDVSMLKAGDLVVGPSSKCELAAVLAHVPDRDESWWRQECVQERELLLYEIASVVSKRFLFWRRSYVVLRSLWDGRLLRVDLAGPFIHGAAAMEFCTIKELAEFARQVSSAVPA